MQSILTAAEYCETRDKVVLWYTSPGAPSGRSIAIIEPETSLPFDLDNIAGEVDENGIFQWDGKGSPCDHQGNTIHNLMLSVEEGIYDAQYAEFMGE